MKALFSLALISVLLTGCVHTTTLYDSLGGDAGIIKITDNLIVNIEASPIIFPYFEESDVMRFRDQFIAHICAISDGPCEYLGDEMNEVHDGMNITESDFNSLVDILYDAMSSAGIEHAVQNQLIARLAPMRKSIIYR